MTRRPPWKALSAFALILAAATARAGEPTSPSLIQVPAWATERMEEKHCSQNALPDASGSWKFQAAEQDGKPCLCIQAGPDNQATCEELTFRTEGVGYVRLKADAGQVHVRGAGVEAHADRVTRTGKAGAKLEMMGKVRLKYERNGQRVEMEAENAVVDLAAGRLQIGPPGEGDGAVDTSSRTASPAVAESAERQSSILAKLFSGVEARTVRLRVTQACPPIAGINRKQVAASLTPALQHAIEVKTPLKVVEKNADLEMSVNLTGFEKVILNYHNLYEQREVEVKLLAEATVRDLRSAERLQREGQSRAASTRLQSVAHFRPELGESISTALTRAADRLASQAAALLERDW
jgi:hypothetical protein